MNNPDHKQIIRQSFDTVAPGYDHPSLAFFPEAAMHMVEYLELLPHQHLLDVCTGTGAVALEAAEKLKQGRVTAIDLSLGMLHQARSKAVLRNLENVEFLQMDLDHLDFPNDAFDVATSSFGLFFVEDMVHGLGNIVDKIKPGGKIAISTFTDNAFSPLADIFLSRYASFGREVPPLSWRRLATHDRIEAHFKAIDILNPAIYHMPLGYQMTSSKTWWDIVWNAGWRGLLNQLSDQEREAFKSIHMEEIDQLIGDDGLWFNTEVLIAIGIKP